MSIIGLVLNVILVSLLMVAIVVGMRLSRRLKVLRDTQDGFAGAVRDLNIAAARAEQGLADLRAATDEATDVLADRIEKGRALAARLERLTAAAPANLPEAAEPEAADRRLGALLAAAREARTRPERRPPPAPRPAAGLPDDELFAEPPLRLDRIGGAAR